LHSIKNKIWETVSKKRNISDNKKVISYLVFVFIATIFWFLNALSKDYTTTVSYPVNYKNLPKDKILIRELPDKLFLEVKGGGFALLRYKISTAFQPINLNVSHQINNKKTRNNILHYIMHTNNTQTKRNISRQLNKDINLQKIIPDTIGLHFANIIQKKVPVVPNVEITYASQFSLDGKITTIPDSIIASGPSTVIDTLQKVYTSLLEFNELDRNTKRNTSLKKIDKISFSNKRVVVKIPIDRYTEASQLIEITPINTPDSLNLRLFPAKIKVNYKVGLNNFNKIGENDFKVIVNYKNLTSKSDFLKIKLKKYPENIKDIEISPSKVEFIIEKKIK
jgi:hypothetical protein